jgi:hypothetical protein
VTESQRKFGHRRDTDDAQGFARCLRAAVAELAKTVAPPTPHVADLIGRTGVVLAGGYFDRRRKVF